MQSLDLGLNLWFTGEYTRMPVLEIRELKKSYLTPEGEQLSVVDVPAFTLDDGEQVALQGGSGSGKTTFLNLIAGILTPDSGSVKVAGLEFTELSEARRDTARAERIGYIFQTFNLLSGYSALENVLLGMMFGPGPDTARAKELLDRVGLKERMDYRPAQLSVGQQQRVAVARALASKPKLVLADEPTGNLDRRHAMEALELIRKTCKENGAALLLVSHDPEVLKKFDRNEKFSALNRAAKG